MKHFVNLHNHSTHSYLDGYGTPKEMIEYAKAQGFKSLALTDHGNIDGSIPFYFEAIKAGIKPILGVEAYICDDNELRSRQGRNHTHHITLLAKNADGFRNITQLTTEAWSKGFYYKPRMSWKSLYKHREGIIVMTGCPNSAVFDNPFRLKELKDNFGKDVFFEVVCSPDPHDFEERVTRAWGFAKKIGMPIVLTGDAHYPAKGDTQTHDIILAINSRGGYDNPNRMRYAPYFWQRNRKDLWEHSQAFLSFLNPKLFDKACDATLEIANRIKFKMPTEMPIQFDTGRMSEVAYLNILIKKGKALRIRQGLKWTTEYETRLKRELKLIKEKGFVSYFLIISDVIIWAKQTGILVGPARGSAAGSLVCWLLRITEINPIKYDLLFERFLDPNRIDAPDIDIDFEDRYRGTVIQYLKKKYGNVGVLSAWSYWRARSCLYDVARIFNIPSSEIRKVTPLIVQRSGGDARASFTLEDTFKEFKVAGDILKAYPNLKHAMSIEAQIRQKTRHAAGVVISSKPMDNIVSHYPDDCISMDGSGAKKVGALKIDILGINTLTVVAKALELIKERHGRNIDIYNIDMDNPKVIEGFRKNKLAGIFQFEGDAMRMVNRQIEARTFNDITVINAASRPGPLHCGGTAMWVRRFRGKEKVTYIHPIIEKITKSTLGITMYQEQVMKLIRELGGMSWKYVAEARQNMSRRLGTEVFNTLYESFKKGAMKNGCTADESKWIWGQICTHGSWSFNLSHAVSYTTLSYWTMFLKVYYPSEFYCASIGYSSSDDRTRQLIKEFKRAGGKLLNVDAYKSQKHPIIEGKNLRMGWLDVNGIGEKVAEELASNAPYTSAQDLVQRTDIPKGTVKLLEDLGIMERAQLDMFLPKERTGFKSLLRKHCPWLFELDLKRFRDNYCKTLEMIEPRNEKQMVITVGVVRSINLRDVNEATAKRGGDKQKLITNNTKFAHLVIEDETDHMYVTFSRKIYPKFKDMIWKDDGVGNIIKVEGVVLPDSRKIYARHAMIVGRI